MLEHASNFSSLMCSSHRKSRSFSDSTWPPIASHTNLWKNHITCHIAAMWMLSMGWQWENKLTWPKPYTFWAHPEVARWILLPLWQDYEMLHHTASSMLHPPPSLAGAYTHPHPSFSHPLCYPFPSFYFRKIDESEKEGLQKTFLLVKTIHAHTPWCFAAPFAAQNRWGSSFGWTILLTIIWFLGNKSDRREVKNEYF